MVEPVATDVLLPDAPTALVSSDGLAPAGLSKYDFVVYGNLIYQLTESTYTTGEALLGSANFTAKESVYREDSIWLREDATYLAVKGQDTPDGYSAVSGENGLYGDGTNYAVPVTDVLRKRNQGAYHHVFNDNGTGQLRNVAQTSNVLFYDTTAINILDRASCFDFHDVTTNSDGTAYNVYAAPTIANGSVRYGSPDLLPFDAIYHHDLKDARISAKEPTDKVQLLTDSMKDLNDGLVRGATGTYETKVEQYEVLDKTTNTLNATGQLATSVKFGNRDIATVASIGDVDVGSHIKMFITDDTGVPYECMGAYPVSDGSWVTLHYRYGAVSANFTAGTISYFITATPTTVQSSSTIRRCALIGDPDNYYRGSYDFLSSDGVQTVKQYDVVKVVSGSTHGTIGHFYRFRNADAGIDLGVIDYSIASNWDNLGPDREDSWLLEGNTLDAEPLLVAEDGSSLIPDGGAQTVKFPNKVLGTPLLRLYSTNSGNSWGGGSLSSWDEATNSLGPVTPASGSLSLIFYTSTVTPLEEYTAPDKTISESQSVIASDSSRLVDQVTGKVATGTDEEKLTVLKEKDGVFTHHPSDLDGTGPAAKFMGKLVRMSDGKGAVEVIGKELVYDAGSTGDDVLPLTAGVAFSFTPGDLVRLTGFVNDNVNYKIFKVGSAASSTWSSTILNTYYIDEEGILRNSAGGINSLGLVLWDGNGWGDDNTIDTVTTDSTDIDDNGQTIRLTKSLVPLNVYLGGDA